MCNDCELRFKCFTQERIFSDPLYQGLYEAMIAQGMEGDAAILAVAEEIKEALRPQPAGTPWQIADGNTWQNGWVKTWESDSTPDNILWSGTGGTTITYTMKDGNQYSWQTFCDSITRITE